jgi:two-component system nitrogen regulation sensor histidine kinase GlnL
MSSQSERFHQLLLDNLHSAVLLLDEQLEVLFVNNAAEMLFGMSARSIHGKPVDQLLQCERGETVMQLREVLETGNPYTGREICIRTPTQKLTVDCTVVPIDEPGEPMVLLVELQQIDRQIRITQEEQLISQQQASQELVRGLAHEIKNPLGGIRGAAQLLELELDDDDLKEYTRVIMKEADRLRNLVNQLLGPNRLPKVQELNIHEVLERVRQLLRVEYGDSLEIGFDYDPSIPPIMGDMDQLIQALLNIAGNAARELGEDGELVLRTRIQRQFTIGSERHNLVVQIDIEDNGPGIPEELRETVFLPMVSGSPDGAGLGLSIAQNLVARHGGIIEFESEPGKTVFKVYLPVE